jgi:hypothetical protein
MFIKLRKKVMAWFRESDDYNEHGCYLYDSSEVPAESNKYASVPARRPRGPRPSPGIAIRGSSPTEYESKFDSRGIFLKLIAGQGGIVLESRQWDQKMDDWHTTVHVIPETEDLSEALSHIITLQALRG